MSVRRASRLVVPELAQTRLAPVEVCGVGLWTPLGRGIKDHCAALAAGAERHRSSSGDGCPIDRGHAHL